LTSFDVGSLSESEFNFEVPFLENDSIKEWVLWMPPNPGFAWNHHFHTEDEVFEYNILNNWPLPNHYFGSRVVFTAREMSKTNFVSELKDFWASWVSSPRLRKGYWQEINRISG